MDLEEIKGLAQVNHEIVRTFSNNLGFTLYAVVLVIGVVLFYVGIIGLIISICRFCFDPFYYRRVAEFRDFHGGNHSGFSLRNSQVPAKTSLVDLTAKVTNAIQE